MNKLQELGRAIVELSKGSPLLAEICEIHLSPLYQYLSEGSEGRNDDEPVLEYFNQNPQILPPQMSHNQLLIPPDVAPPFFGQVQPMVNPGLFIPTPNIPFLYHNQA